MKRIALVLAVAAFIIPSAAAQDLPVVEFGIGPGFLSYGIDCQYSDPAGMSAIYGDHIMTDWDNVGPGTTWDIAAAYPAQESPFALNTLFLVRLPLTKRLAIAYSNRVAFAFDHIVHREDRYGDSDRLVITLAGITGAELECYLMEPGKGLWLGAFGGLSVLNQPFVKSYFTQLGFGAGGTVGWRMSRKTAFELNGFYFSTNILQSTVDKILALSDNLAFSGKASGFSLTAGIRFGL